MTTKLQSLTELWQEFNLTGTQKLLDELATEITTKQDESDISRKQLIDLIRTFKKSNSEETRLVVAPLLKSFQNEIDMLSKRSKSAEKAFFDIYKKFCDIADPVPTLEYCMENMKNLQRLQDLEIENNQLRETMGDYNKEITEYKEKTKNLKDVEEKLERQETNMEETIEKKIKSREDDLNNAFDEKVKNFEEEKLRNGHKLADSETKLKQLQSLLDESQSELFEMKSRQDDKRNAISDDMDLMMTDLDRANQRALTAEKEVINLQEKVSELKESISKDDQDDEGMHDEEASELRFQLHAKEKEVIQLVEDIQKANRNLQENEVKYERKVTDLEKGLTEVEKTKDELQVKLSKQSDYESVKKDLSILKTLEFPSHSTDQDDSRPLEVLILERSKALQTDNSMLRQDKERLVRELGDTKTDLYEAQQKVEKQTELISQLEDHVEQLQTISTPYREEAEGRSSSDMLAEALKINTVEEVFEREASMSPSMGNRSLMSPASYISPGDSSSTLLPIVQAQRERFRLRNDELESSSLEQQHQLGILSGQVHDLQQDNVKLYEKIRFLQACGGANRRQGDTVVPVETRYQGEYEQKLDPFQSFSQAEKKRKYGQLSVIEKVILSLVRFMVSNKTVRLMVTFYSILLHGLVFAVLYKMAMTESCKHDMAARWHEKYIEHMQDVHGDADHHIG
eukprot:TRINITY_DN15571_c0_g1_i1.p1 TRINITY_DN15571_c0_g1~~TRINITY_DN15571_c0_g1_i1.p1  ORF type:complete len:685 (-),score=295.80 TRINITY_DN15571_c0_g1_i1:153-2207(-)